MRILYCMNATWGWIKQRPHFLAEGLSEYFNVLVVAKKEYKKTVENDIFTINLRYLFRLPFERFKIVAVINNLIYGIQIWLLSRSVDVIWIASPLQYGFARFSCKGKFVIYDCMDNQIELQKCIKMRGKIAKLEKKLFDRADLVFASATHLKQVLINKYGDKEIFVVNNAIKDNFKEKIIPLPLNIKKKFDSEKTNITYIGTISSWMNFDVVRMILNKVPNVVVNFFGPIDVKKLPDINGVIFHGPVVHDYVFGLMEESDILIMPFIVNNLIESVNPVKLYEYIFSGKACVAPYYGESVFFEDYVYLYKTEDECCRMIEDIIANGYQSKKSKNEVEVFAMNNTWSSRIKRIVEIMSKSNSTL